MTINWREQIIEKCKNSDNTLNIVETINVIFSDYWPMVHNTTTQKLGRDCAGDNDQEWYKTADQVAARMADQVLARHIVSRIR